MPTHKETSKPRRKTAGEAAPEQLFVLSLSEGQLTVLEDALDIYSRLGMGQIKVAADILACLDSQAADILREAMASIRITGGVQSISSREIPDDFRIAYDMQQVARYGLHLLRCETDPDYRQNCAAYVTSDPPRRYSSCEPNLPALFMNAIKRR